MSKLLFFICNMTLACGGFAQGLSEIQFTDGKWVLELSNKPGTSIKTFQLINTFTNDTSNVKQSVIDSLNKPGALIVITIDSLTKPLDIDTNECEVSSVVNDSIVRTLSWCNYSGLQMYSIVFLDSEELHSNNYGSKGNTEYSGLSKPTIGKPNNRDSAMVFINGKLYKRDGSIYTNITFYAAHCWDAKTGKGYIQTDSLGNFSLATWPIIRNNQYGCGAGPEYFNIEIYEPVHEAFYTGGYTSLYPGTVNIDIKGRWVNAPDVGNINFTLSPNPAKGTITATYELPAGEDYRHCQLRVSNAAGQTVRTAKLQAAGGKQGIPLEGLPGGVYYCTLAGGKGVLQTGRFVVE